MKLALLSDVHANVRALDACLAHARTQGAQQFAILGDLVGYGAEPAAVVERVMALADSGALVLQGNHDALAVQPPAPVAPGAAQTQTMQDATAAWTHAQLSTAQRAFLADLPLEQRHPPVLLVHASAKTPQQWLYVDSERRAAECLDAAGEDTRYVFVGHVHHQSVYFRGQGRGLMQFEPVPGAALPVPAHRHWVATVGSVGQPRDGKPQAMYALFDQARAQLVFHRVAYDYWSAAAAVRAAGLPEPLAKRLEIGR